MLPLFSYLKSSEVLRKLKVSKLIPHNREKVFKEIADFENYVNFIPGCSKAKLIEQGNGFEIGLLEFDFLLRKYEIKSKNILSNYQIEIEQIEGPFETFNGCWKVNAKADDVTEATLSAEFELPFLLDNLLPENLINSFGEAAIQGFLKNIKD